VGSAAGTAAAVGSDIGLLAPAAANVGDTTAALFGVGGSENCARIPMLLGVGGSENMSIMAAVPVGEVATD